jgi:glycosyltransferase involved in cell wall biosynthesis
MNAAGSEAARQSDAPAASNLRDGAVQFHVVSFEGPDPYACAGGIASRITGLTQALAELGLDTHLWFIGDPALPGHERRGALTLHRWCQWISTHHAGGVYDGEEEKRADLVASLPPYLTEHVLLPYLRTPGARAVVLAEEWHTVDAVLHLDWLLRRAGARERVQIFWNANNVFGFERIDWRRLRDAAALTTVSRYMRYRMWAHGVDPAVIPNGLARDAFVPPHRGAVSGLRARLRDRTVLGKVARWDPDKNWLLTIDTVGELKRHGFAPLLIARGGVEAHRGEVLAHAARRGLRVVDCAPPPSLDGLLGCVGVMQRADILNLRTPLTPETRRVLFRGADAVLANSGHEPFGLVGLEAMAAGGLACTGATGEDYARPGHNAVVLQSQDPREFVGVLRRLRADPSSERELRRNGRATAIQFAWREIVDRLLLPHIGLRNQM